MVYKKKDVLGLDIGTGLIKYVQLKKRKGLTKLIGYGHIEMPKDVIVEGIISEPEKLAKLVAERLKNPDWGKITASQIVASLPESKIFTRTIEIPSIKESDIDEAINYEVEQSIPMPLSDLYTDWQIVAEGKDNYSVFLAAAPRAIIDSYVQFIHELKLEPLALEVSLAAISRSIVPATDKSKTSLIIDVGSQTTNMAIFRDNLQVAASAPLGAEIIKETLKKTLNISQKEANTLLMSGLSEKTKAAEVIKVELSKILEEVDRLICYHKERSECQVIDQILLCGGIGNMKGLAEFIESSTKITTKTGNPWTNISIYPLKPVAKNEAALYSAAIGLCLRGLNDE